MSKNRSLKRKRKKAALRRGPQFNRLPRNRQDLSTLVLSEFTITEKPIDLYELPSEIENEIEELHYQCQENPGEAIGRLKILIQEYPEVPQFYNYLVPG